MISKGTDNIGDPAVPSADKEPERSRMLLMPTPKQVRAESAGAGRWPAVARSLAHSESSVCFRLSVSELVVSLRAPFPEPWQGSRLRGQKSTPRGTRDPVQVSARVSALGPRGGLCQRTGGCQGT